MNARRFFAGALLTTLSLSLLITSAAPEAQPLKGREGIAKQAARNIEHGKMLFAQNCAYCHAASASERAKLPETYRPSVDVTTKSESFSPGPLELWRSISGGNPTIELPGHDFSHLGEDNLWFIIQALRERAGLQDVTDSPEMRSIVLASRKSGACFEPIKAEVTAYTTELDAARSARGAASYAANCASCHGADGMGSKEHPRATKLASADTIWRRRTAPLDIYKSITKESGIKQHAKIELPLEEQWAMVLWMRAEMIPAQKLREQPEIPMRGHVIEECRKLSEEAKPVGAKPEVYNNPTAYRAALPSPSPDLSDPAQEALAEKLYARHCANCHAKDGLGAPGQFPPLAKSTWLKANSAEAAIDVLLLGMSGEVKVNGTTYNGFMQGYGEKLDDAEVAMIATYMNTRWGNKGGPVTAEQVAARRGAKGLTPKPAGPAAQQPQLARRTGAITARPCGMCHGDAIPGGEDAVKLLATISVEGYGGKQHPLMGQSMTLHQLTGLLTHADPKHAYLTPQQTIAWLRGL